MDAPGRGGTWGLSSVLEAGQVLSLTSLTLAEVAQETLVHAGGLGGQCELSTCFPCLLTGLCSWNSHPQLPDQLPVPVDSNPPSALCPVLLTGWAANPQWWTHLPATYPGDVSLFRPALRGPVLAGLPPDSHSLTL